MAEVSSGSFETGKYDGVRGLKFNWWVNSQSISGNYTDIGWNFVGSGSNSNPWYYTLNGYLDINGSRVYTQNSTKIQLYVGTVIASGTARIYHNSDGKKRFGASGGATIYNYGTYQTGSGEWDLPSIPRQANITSAPNFNDEQNPTINYSNPAGNSVSSLSACISLTGAKDDIPYRNISKTGTSYTFNLTEAERKILRDACKTSNKLNVKFYIRTVIGNNTFHSISDKEMTIINGKPTFASSNISYQDTNSAITAITGNNQHIVRNLSNLKVTITSATANKSAIISKYEITFNGVTKSLTSAGTVDFGKLNISQNASVSVKVIDSRGNSTTISKTVVVLDWVLPSAVITRGRVNNYEDNTKIKAQVTISSVNSKNSIQSIQFRYKKTTDTDYSPYQSLSNNVEKELILDKLFAWDFQVVIKDKFGTSTYNFIIAKGIPIMFIDVRLKSVGINCFPTKENSFEVEGYDFENIHPINSVIITTANTNPAATGINGTWELATSQKINDVTFYYWKRTA